MDNLEPYQGFYAKKGYGEYEKHFLHYAPVSMLNIYMYNNQVVSSYIYIFKYQQHFCFKLIFYSPNNILNSLIFIVNFLYNLTNLF